MAAVLTLWSIATVAYGANWYFQPAGTVGLGYEENANLTDEDPINTTRYELSGSARGGRLTERSQVIGNLRATSLRYPGNEQLESDNLSAVLDSAFLPTELDRLSLGLRFDRNTSRSSEITTTGNIIENVPRNSIRIEPAWERRLTERSTVGLRYEYARVSFDNNTSGLIDYEQDGINSFYEYQLTERLRLRGTLGAVSYDPDDVVRYKGYDGTLGLSYAFSETLAGNLDVGYQRIESEMDLGSDTVNRTTGDTLYGVSLSKEFARSSLDLAMRRDIVPTGSGEPLVQERLILAYVYRFSPRLSVTIPAAIVRSETISFDDADADEERRTFLSSQPRLSWRVTEDIMLNASYRYQYQHYNEDDTSADGNAVFLSLSYVWPTERSALAR